MTSRALDRSELNDLLASVEFEALAEPAWAAPAFGPEVAENEQNELSRLADRDGSCLKGLLHAIGIEATAAVLLFLAWQLWMAHR